MAFYNKQGLKQGTFYCKNVFSHEGKKRSQNKVINSLKINMFINQTDTNNKLTYKKVKFTVFFLILH